MTRLVVKVVVVDEVELNVRVKFSVPFIQWKRPLGKNWGRVRVYGGTC